MRDLRHLTKWRDRHYPDLLIRELDPPMVQNWIDDLRGQVDAGEIKPRSFHRRLSVLSALFRWAAEPSRSGVTGIGRNLVPAKSHQTTYPSCWVLWLRAVIDQPGTTVILF